MILSLAEYIRLLKEYEKMDKTNAIIEAPILDMSILVVDQGISTSDLNVCFFMRYTNIHHYKEIYEDEQTKYSVSIIRNNLFHSTYNWEVSRVSSETMMAAPAFSFFLHNKT